MSESVNQAIRAGYKENFKVSDGKLTTSDQEMVYKPDEILIADFFRFEGYSDPADNSVLYLIETPDGKKGILIDAYGTDADAQLSKFIRQTKTIRKKRAE